jgi:alkanesulfonate monooxygenase SsuD/methylene tetrahydromethanopterin reductase-like flavin-dependent oxidoreductase (luciferase family)
MRFYINILTYYPDLDPPYEVYYQQILEQIELAEELGWECFMFNEHHFLGYGGLVANPAVLLAWRRNRSWKQQIVERKWVGCLLS